jgi:hypothetical protein
MLYRLHRCSLGVLDRRYICILTLLLNSYNTIYWQQSGPVIISGVRMASHLQYQMTETTILMYGM